MAFFRSNLASGGGGSGVPEFSRTTIAEDSTGTGTLTFTEDYHDYDILLVRLANVETLAVTDVYATASMIDDIYTLMSGIVWNETASNQYAEYAESGSAWTRGSYRNVYISKIIGINCTNKTVTETEIYNRGAYTTTEEAITSTGLFDYDIIVASYAYDGIQFGSVPILKDDMETTDGTRDIMTTPYNGLYVRKMTNTSMSAGFYYSVHGIKFT